MFLHTVSFDRNRSFYDNSKVFFLSPHYRGDDYREKHRVPFLYRRRPLVCVVVMCMHAFIFAGIGAHLFLLASITDVLILEISNRYESRRRFRASVCDGTVPIFCNEVS